MSIGKGLPTLEAGRGHATPHMPVETAKCWWLFSQMRGRVAKAAVQSALTFKLYELLSSLVSYTA